MEKRFQVFVSSTFADLEDERRRVIQTLMKMDCIPVGMELFPATDEDQFEFIKRIINDCDYYLLIIGGRYGSLTAQGISFTEQEYDYALERKLKVIALLHKNPDQITYDKSEQDPELRILLQAFRDKAANGRMVEFWQKADELPGIVALSLINTIKMFPAVGWVRADKVSSEDLLIEINDLRKQNAELKIALSEIKPNIFTGSEEKDFSYICSRLNRFEDVEVTISKKGTKEKEIEKHLINIVSLIPFFSESYEFSKHLLSWVISRELFTDSNKDTNYSVKLIKKLDVELLMYGLLTKNYTPPVVMNSTGIRGDAQSHLLQGEYRLMFSEKFERFKYWLAVNNKIFDHIEFKKI